MTSPQQRRGDRAEREIAAKIAELTGWRVRRKLGVGRTDDTGDLEISTATPGGWMPLPITAQVKDHANVQRAISDTLHDLPIQQVNAGSTFAAGFVRRRGGEWVVVMNLEQFCTLAREALG